MATLGAPWTVIGDGTSGGVGSRPPLATWYDQSNELFIGLLHYGLCNENSPKSQPESASSVNVRFQTYSVPTGNHGADRSAASSRGELIQREEPIVVELPVGVVGQTSSTPGQDGEEESPMMLAKLSLDQKYLAIQFSNTMVRIAKIGDEADSVRDADIRISGEQSKQSTSIDDGAAAAYCKFRKQWTIDLTASSGEEPLVSDPGDIPRRDLFAGGAGAVARAAGFHARKFLNRRSKGTSSSNETDGNAAFAKNEILPGGVLWIDRHGDGHPILILVTSRSVLLYKISPETHSMKRFASYSVPTVIDRFWYEPQARCLMVGSLCQLFEDGKNIETFDMRAWSFRRQLREGDNRSDQIRRNCDACYETTIFEQFTVGKTVDGLFLFESISLVSLYNHVFCLAIGEKSATYIKLDASTRRVSQLTDVPYPNMTGQLELNVTRGLISIVDNAVIIIDRSSSKCLLLDVNEPSNRPFAAWISSVGFDTCNEETSSFLPPSSLLDSSGRGRLHIIFLDLQLIVKSVPMNAGVVSFLLRRRGEYERNGLRLAIDAISRVFDDKSNDSSSLLPTFIDVLSVHEDGNLMDGLDSAACLPLVHQAALLSSDGVSAPVPIEHDSVDRTSRLSFLSQSDMLHKILIPQAKKAISRNDTAQLDRLCEFSLLYMQSLEQRKLLRTPALEVYACALLWRQRNGEEIVSMLRARPQWREMNRHQSPSFEEDVLGQEALAEMLIAIVTDPTCKYGGKDDKLIVGYAIDLLNNIRSFQVAGKHLLVLGRCGDAIAVTQKAISHKSNSQQKQQIVPIKGAVASDFFCAAINEAKTLESVGDRCRLLFNVHSFISDYDPDCMVMTQCDSGELQSALASKFGRFPSELFGGDSDSSAISLRAMFGFSIAHAQGEQYM